MTRQEQIEKLGNTIIYLSNNMNNLSKTKLLKLLYLLDQYSVEKFGTPFLNLKYEVWKLGPVCQEVFAQLDCNESLTSLKDFIEVSFLQDGTSKIISKKDFSDDEFSQNDINLLDLVVKSFKNDTANKLVNLTHVKGGLWYDLALKNDLLESFENEFRSTSNIEIDFSELLKNNSTKLNLYNDYLEFDKFSKSF